MSKKILALVLALVMCLSLAACGDKPAPGNSNEPNNPSSNSSTENKDGFTALEVDKDKRVSDIEITGMKMEKEQYAVGEAIMVTVTWKGTPADDTWIGIIPADTPHGSEEKNDEYDVDYRYFTDAKSGDIFAFENISLEPGDYTMRINESDAGGVELAWCAFSVKGENNGSQGESDPQGGNNEPAVSIPEGYAAYVNQGAVILYPTDRFKEGMMGGIEGVENDIPWVRLSILGDSFDKQKDLCEQEHGSSSDYSLSEITVGEHKALKCIYSDSASYFMEVIIDTSFINDEFWSCVAVKVDVPKSQGDLSMFEDETLWEIINSFYFDSAQKYSF